ncbi:MAG: HesB/IscA family protein [Gemmataceae bacterium]
MAINVTEKAANEVKRIIDQQRGQNPEAPANIYLRMRVVGGGCSGFQNRLDLDPEFNEGKDMLFEFHGVPVVVDKRSMMYLSDVTVDYHNEDPMKQGFSINNPQAKGTCGCGSSYSM